MSASLAPGCLTWLLALLFAPFFLGVQSEFAPPEAELVEPILPEAVTDYPLGIWLAPIDEAAPEQLEESASIITARLELAEIDSAVVVDAGQIQIQTWGTSEEVVPLVTQIGLLEFVGMSDVDPLPLEGDCLQTTEIEMRFGESLLCPNIGGGEAPFTLADGEPFPTTFTDEIIEEASATAAPTPPVWWVTVDFTPEGSSAFGDYTEEQVGEPLAMLLDGEVVSMLTINNRIEGYGILGNFDQEEAERLAIILNTEPLPIRLQVLAMASYSVEE